ncbi:MAG: hypothetical protein M3279_02025, partial [Actinomycetota bacterium]|nr:hypothetical protein [Actinomycetota bacterium]
MTHREPLPATAYSAARASIAMWRVWVDALPGAWTEERDGAAGVVTGLDSIDHNGVWVARKRVRAATVRELLDEVASTGLPHCLQLRRPASPALVRVARDHGMVLDAEEPLMILRSRAIVERAARLEGLSIRALGPDEGELLASITVPVFGGSPEVTAAAASPRVLSHPAVRCYVGE